MRTNTVITTFYLLLFVSFFQSSFSQNSMHVLDPQRWGQRVASADNLEIYVKPSGTFAEVSYTFEINGYSSGYDEDIQLEWVAQFTMPTGIVFNDSWLYIDDYISKGVIYDKREGVEIYESIVDRRQDPSILTKETDNRYMLRVYPLFADSTRKIKLSYLTPLSVNGTEASLDIALSLFQLSNAPVRTAKLFIQESPDWAFVDNPDLSYQGINSDGAQEYTISSFEDYGNLSLNFSSAFDVSDYYFGQYLTSDENYFQFTFNPSVDNDLSPKYHLVSFNHNETTSAFSKDYLLNEMESLLKKKLNDTDFFNIIYHDFGVKLLSDDWITGDDESLEESFNAVKDNENGVGTMAEEFLTGLEFLNSKNTDATFTLISSDVSLNSESLSRDLQQEIETMLAENNNEIKISIYDFAVKSLPRKIINSRTYWGNEYLYSLLEQNGGISSQTYLDYWDLGEFTNSMFTEEPTYITEIELDLEPKDGFAYSEYFVSNSDNAFQSNLPVTIVGKYIGNFPMTFEFKGINDDGNFFDRSFEITEDQVIEIDALAKSALYGQYILENENSSNPQIRDEVVRVSKKERLLAKLTTFLCLENEAVGSEENEDEVTSTEEIIEVEDTRFVASPNPFSDQLTISIPHDFISNRKAVQIKIFDMNGRLIDKDTINENTSSGAFEYKWQASADLLPGVYVIKVSNGIEVVNLKVIYVR